MRRFSWFVLVKCVDYPIRMRHFSSRAIALGANFANKEIGRFTKSGSSMEEEKHKKPLLSYEEVIEVISIIIHIIAWYIRELMIMIL